MLKILWSAIAYVIALAILAFMGFWVILILGILLGP